MRSNYQVLLILHDIVQNDPQPLSYTCRPRELILRCMQDWSTIQNEINLLEDEGLVSTWQSDTLLIQITQKGIDFVGSIKEGSINKNQT